MKRPMLNAERFAYSSAPQRRSRIVQFVAERGYCTIVELSGVFEVSEMTIRRDVSQLVDEGKLRGFHGGVGSLLPEQMLGRDYVDRDRSMSDAKKSIARRALRMVTPGSAIAIDAGTTATHLAGFLPFDLGLRVVTHSLSAVSVLAAEGMIEVDCLGVVLPTETMSFAGPSTLAAISDLQIETFFLAASGLSERGVFCGTGFDATTKRALIEVSANVVLLADSSKFSTLAMVKVCDWESVDVVITDSAIGSEQRTLLEQYGVDLEIA